MKFIDFKNTHIGETCLAIGNGPSLADVPLDFLNKYPSFGSNGIYLLEGFEPTYYVSVNPEVLKQFDGIGDIKAPKFVAEAFADFFDNSYPLHSVGIPKFSRDPHKWIYEGHTVTFVSLQLAYFMGFKTVLMVGVDHRFTYEGRPNELRKMEGDDPNHFIKTYFKGKNWNNPDLERSAMAYQLAKTEFEDDGRSIINLTPNTGENVFEKGNINDW